MHECMLNSKVIVPKIIYTKALSALQMIFEGLNVYLFTHFLQSLKTKVVLTSRPQKTEEARNNIFLKKSICRCSIQVLVEAPVLQGRSEQAGTAVCSV